jgi:hypothetical protein
MVILMAIAIAISMAIQKIQNPKSKIQILNSKILLCQYDS